MNTAETMTWAEFSERLRTAIQGDTTYEEDQAAHDLINEIMTWIARRRYERGV